MLKINPVKTTSKSFNKLKIFIYEFIKFAVKTNSKIY